MLSVLSGSAFIVNTASSPAEGLLLVSVRQTNDFAIQGIVEGGVPQDPEPQNGGAAAAANFEPEPEPAAAPQYFHPEQQPVFEMSGLDNDGDGFYFIDGEFEGKPVYRKVGTESCDPKEPWKAGIALWCTSKYGRWDSELYNSRASSLLFVRATNCTDCDCMRKLLAAVCSVQILHLRLD